MSIEFWYMRTSAVAKVVGYTVCRKFLSCVEWFNHVTLSSLEMFRLKVLLCNEGEEN